MQKRDLPYLVFGILITAVASCRSATENNFPPVEPELIAITPFDSAVDAAATAVPTAEPPRPGALPTTADAWPTIGGNRAGLALTIPPGWSNLTDQISPAIENRLGINLLFAADSERTGRSLLAGKSFARGATLTGLLVSPPPPPADPAAALIELLTSAAPSAVRLTPITPITSANGVDGFVVDVGDGPVGLNVPGGDLRTRVALFVPPAAEGADGPTWIALLLSASAEVWPQYVPTFDRILASAEVFAVRPGQTAQEGNVVVRGDLQGDSVQVEATLERGVSDLWTFNAGGGRYASLFLRPAEPLLDLSLTLLGPDRQTIAHVANGFAGATEAATDVWLPQPGVYLLQVSEFGGASGRYTLALTLSDQPQHNDGGPIAFDQALQGQLPPNGQQVWVFSGVARQRVSIVVAPQATTFDAILDLVGPDGNILFTLDEGFSGDPEVVSAYELPAAGEYAVVVRSFSAQGGPYTLSLDEGDRPIDNFYDAGDLAYGAVSAETLQGQEAHAWFLQGKAGDHILVRVTPRSANLDLDVWLLDAAVERVAAADEFAAGEPETMELTLDADGQYIVLVRDFNGEPGEYEIALGAAPAATPETAGMLGYGDAVIGAVQPGTAVAWTFSAAAGDVINVAAQAADSSGDLVLQLVGPDGLTAREVDDSPAGGDEAIRAYVVPAAGQWRVVLREFFNGMANYRLTLERAR